MKKELKKVSRERDEALNKLATVQHSDQPANYGTLKQGDKSQASSRDYENLKMQCEKAMAEVQGLLKQNMEITRKYENTLKDVDYYRKQERAAYTALQNLRMQYEEWLKRFIDNLKLQVTQDLIISPKSDDEMPMWQQGRGEPARRRTLSSCRLECASHPECGCLSCHSPQSHLYTLVSTPLWSMVKLPATPETHATCHSLHLTKSLLRVVEGWLRSVSEYHKGGSVWPVSQGVASIITSTSRQSLKSLMQS
ncbi:hypothetical protein E2C01_012437 [Portunus trituberculatus]|uniref:Disks large homolog 5 N-terminal domain-containing protein n=1 Tax=Portunus trituberculatus TaxID=210409 RepID=A0A5B7DDN1_PORTR|nr:hypothetical protein [Portunus trituberculatus]